jgi:hypothetical protein
MGLIELTSPPPLPTVTITSFSFGSIGTTTALPSVAAANTNATSLSAVLYQSNGVNDSGYVSISTITQTPTGSNTITYNSNTIVDYWYYWTVTVTNASGSASASTTHLKNDSSQGAFSIVLSPTQLFFPGSTMAIPYTSATITGSADQIYWSLYESNGSGFPNDDLLDSGTIYAPLDEPQGIGSETYTRIGRQFYYFAEASGEDGKTSDESTLSPPNNPET